MEALLIDEWVGQRDAIAVLDEASLSVVRDRVRAVGTGGVPADVVDRAVLVATEIGRNQLRHARGGQIAVERLVRGEHVGLEILGVDAGGGLEDPASAIDASARASGSLGVGIGSIRRLSSEVDFDVRLGEGTRIVARVFDPEAPRHREVGVYGRPFPGENVSGDHATFLRENGALVLAVCDGLGHGPPARAAASVAMRSFARHVRSPPEMLATAHHDGAATRGVVMAVFRATETVDATPFETSSIGNVDVQLCVPRSSRRFGGVSGIVGGRGNVLPRIRSDIGSWAPNEVLVISTDGITSKLRLDEELALLRAHPIVIAQHIVATWARPNDDALVLVAR